MTSKVKWQGLIIGVQPRINLLRSFDAKTHKYLGYILRVNGTLDEYEMEFLVGIGKSTEAKYQIKVGDLVRGEAIEVPIFMDEVIGLYKVSKLKILQRGTEIRIDEPPWTGVPPDMETYREFGHKRLAARTYEKNCIKCVWGCKMAVEIIIDQWNPSKKRHRFETFCYSSFTCKIYKAGPVRKVPGRGLMVWEDPN